MFDIKTSIDSILEFLGNERDFIRYQNNRMLRRTVERELEIIGEATGKVLKLNPAIEINEARKIVDLRNWVIHGYDKIDDIIVWGVVSKQIPLLKKQIDSLLEI